MWSLNLGSIGAISSCGLELDITRKEEKRKCFSQLLYTVMWKTLLLYNIWKKKTSRIFFSLMQIKVSWTRLARKLQKWAQSTLVFEEPFSSQATWKAARDSAPKCDPKPIGTSTKNGENRHQGSKSCWKTLKSQFRCVPPLGFYYLRTFLCEVRRKAWSNCHHLRFSISILTVKKYIHTLPCPS